MIYSSVHKRGSLSQENWKHSETFFHNSYLRRLLNITWKDKVENDTVRAYHRTTRYVGNYIQGKTTVWKTSEELHWIPDVKSNRG